MCEDLLKSLNPTNVKNLVIKIAEGSLDSKQFHNKKQYAKSSKNLITTLELTLAWEICKYKEIL